MGRSIFSTYIILFSILLCIKAINASNVGEDPEVHMNVTQLITSKGYPCEEYTVQTRDGYLLGLQRIPYGRKETGLSPRPVVFLQHGLLCSSAAWLTNLANESFAFILADAGFDVWLGNNRGNTYSHHHIHLNASQVEFWQFSWDEMAEYDIPAMIDFALLTSKQSQLSYIAHSQGSMIMFAHMSKHPEMTKKVKTFYALGPVSTIGHLVSPAIKLLAHLKNYLYDIFGHRDFFPSDGILNWLAQDVCTEETQIFCSDIIFVICGFDPKQLNQTRLPVYMSHLVAGTSVQNMLHFAQMYESGKFQAYNYGSAKKNKQHYGQKDPPLYYLEHVTAPTVLFWSDNDWLADPQDVKGLIRKLPNLSHSFELHDWDHVDFLLALDAPRLVYDKIIAMLIKHSKY